MRQSPHRSSLPSLLLATAALLLAAGCGGPGEEDDPKADAGHQVTDGGKDDTDGGKDDTDGGKDDTDGGQDDNDGGPDDHDGGPDDNDGGPDDHDGGPDDRDGGPDDNDGGLDDPDELAEDEIAQAYHDAVCAFIVRCDAEQGLDQATCAAVIGELAHDGASFGSPRGLEDSVKAGIVTFDGEKALGCFDALRNAACDGQRRSPFDLSRHSACADAFVGTRSSGESCLVDQACAGDAACFRTSDQDACEASCFARPDNGCLADDECESSVCLFRDGPFGTCLVAGGLGAPCPDEHPASCQEGLICEWVDTGDSMELTCIAPPGLDEPCTRACAPGLACGPADEGSFCRAMPDTVGAACRPDAGCAGDLACLDIAPGPTCAALPGEGENCSNNYEGTRCAAGLVCDSEELCSVPREAGEECYASEDCAQGFDCISGEFGPVCGHLPSTEGADCSQGQACGGGLVCLAGEGDGLTCQTTQVGDPCDGACSSGQLCDYSSEPRTCKALPVEGDCIMGRCAEGSFCDYLPPTPTCVVQGAAGEPCEYDESCASGLKCHWVSSAEQRLCALPAALDEDCRDAPCQAGLVCDERGDGTCKQGPSVGEACAWTGTCGEGAYCFRPPEEFQCRPAGGEGEPCLKDDACHPGHECRYVEGADGQLCVAVAEEGDDCSLENDGPVCADDLLCIPTVLDIADPKAKCVRPKGEGQPCTLLLECGGVESGLYCDVEGTSTCVARPGPGEPCLVILPGVFAVCHPLTAYCPSPLEPVCAAFKADGESCTSGLECGSEMGIGECIEDGDGSICVRRGMQICVP